MKPGLRPRTLEELQAKCAEIGAEIDSRRHGEPGIHDYVTIILRPSEPTNQAVFVYPGLGQFAGWRLGMIRFTHLDTRAGEPWFDEIIDLVFTEDPDHG